MSATAGDEPPWLTHPLFINLIQLSLTAVVIGFTSAQSLTRLAFAPFQFILAWFAYQHCVKGAVSVLTTSSLFLAVLANPLMYIERALISGWDFQAQGPTKLYSSGLELSPRTRTLDKGHQSSLWLQFRFGCNAASSARQLNTRYEVKNSPHFSSKNSGYVPSRRAYIGGAFARIFFCYAFLDLTELAEQLQPQEATLFLTPHYAPLFSRLSDVTAPELVSRCITVAMTPVNTWCIIQIVYNTLGILHIATGLGNVRDWRPAFGPLLKVYTIQQFWGSFWHQFLRTVLFCPGTLIAHRILGLPRGVTAACIKIFSAFFLSGILHTIFDLACHHPLERSGALRFFCMQSLGIITETVVRVAWDKVCENIYKEAQYPPDSKVLGPTAPATWKRAVGVLWVASFMIWTVPGWMYIHVSEHHTRILPYSVLDRVIF